MGRRDEARGLLAGHPPESMGGDPDDVSGGDVEMAWRERVRRRVPFVNGRNCRMVGLALVLLLMTVGFLVSMIQGVRHDKVSRVFLLFQESSHSRCRDSFFVPCAFTYPRDTTSGKSEDDDNS